MSLASSKTDKPDTALFTRPIWLLGSDHQHRVGPRHGEAVTVVRGLCTFKAPCDMGLLAFVEMELLPSLSSLGFDRTSVRYKPHPHSLAWWCSHTGHSAGQMSRQLQNRSILPQPTSPPWPSRTEKIILMSFRPLDLPSSLTLGYQMGRMF